MFQFLEKLEIFALPLVTLLKCRVCPTDVNLDFLTSLYFLFIVISSSVYFIMFLHYTYASCLKCFWEQGWE